MVTNKGDCTTNLQGFSQHTPITVNAKDGTEASKSDEVTNLKRLNEHLLTTITNDRKEIDGLKNKLRLCDDANNKLLETVTSDKNKWISCEKDMKGTISELEYKLKEARNLSENHEMLFSQLGREKSLLENRLKESSDVIQELQGLKSELDQTKQLSENLGKLCAQLGQEKNELENNLKKSNDVIKELQNKVTEDRSLWDASKTKLEGTIVEVENKLDSVVQERNVLSQKHKDLCGSYRNEKKGWKKCNGGANMKLKAKMTENQGLWDSYRVNLEGKVAELQNEMTNSKSLNERLLTTITNDRKEIDGLKNKLIMCDDANNKLLETITSDKNKWTSYEKKMKSTISELGQGKNELENDLKKSNDVIRELQDKMTEDRSLWDASKTKLEATIVEVQTKLDTVVKERNELSQKHEDLYTSYRNDKNELKKCNDGAMKLKAKMAEDKGLWDSCRANLKGKVARLQNEILDERKSSQKHQELLTKLRQEKIEMENKFIKINDTTKKLNAKITEDKLLWDSCQEKLEKQVSELQNELNEARVFSQGREELCSELRRAKTDLEEKVLQLEGDLNEARILIKKHEELLSELMKEKNEMQNKVTECNDETEELKAKLAERGFLWDSSKTELEATVAGLQNELKETRLLSLKHEEACIQLRHEKTKLEDELKDLDDTNEELHAKMTENGWLWDTCKANLEGTVIKLQKKLNETKILAHNNQVLYNEISREKSEMETNFHQSINEAKQLKDKIAEEGHLWDISKREFEVTFAKLQNELNEARMLSQKHEDSWSQSEQEKTELENNFNQSINEIQQLKEKLAEDRHKWDSYKREFEITIAKLQNELNEARMLSQKHEDLWSQSEQEKNDLEKTLIGLQNEVDETKILTVKDQELCKVLREENNRIGNKLKQCNDSIGKLNTKVKEDQLLWVCNKEDLESRVAVVQYEKETLIQEYKALWAHLRDEKYELEEKLKECNDRNKELHAQMREDCRLWEACKAKFENSAARLQNNFNKSINEIKQLKEKLAEDKHMWNTSKGEFEVTIAKLQNELNEARMLSHKHEDLCSQSEHEKYELEKTFIRLQNKLDETNILREKDQELCNVLREENNWLGNKLKDCNDRIAELNKNIEEDERLWVTNKSDLERKVAGLQSEKGVLSKEYKLLWAHLTDEKDELENKLRECKDRNMELHAQMREDCRLWEACKANFEDSVAGLQNKLDLMTNEGMILSQEYVELCIECEFLKAQLGDYNDILSSMEDETRSLISLSESNANTVEALQTQVRMITHEHTHLSMKYEELTNENESQKLKLENYNHRLDSVKNERNSLRSTSESREEALLQENGSLKQQVHELQSKLGMWANDYKQVPTDDMLDSETEERQLLTSLSETSDKVMEDPVIENRTVKREALQLYQENQQLQKDISSKKSLIQTKDGNITELNAKKIKLKNAVEVLEEIGRKNTQVLKEYGGIREEQVTRKESEEKRKEGSGRVSHRNQTAFIGNLMSCILLDIEKSDVSRCLSTATKNIILPSDALLCGCPYGWFGGIV
ncbi:uncharacterized protein LOC131052217 [Cryptomeria japonica]|uniref:uncharacterized protein LOC131052217 n=1 Tax=Cryptomeria japonica TaxID=3369 RepID=UPI0027DA5CB8|nr:uncharacterized protein LOC131052217 [Cryptomeria japonica]